MIHTLWATRSMCTVSHLHNTTVKRVLKFQFESKKLGEPGKAPIGYFTGPKSHLTSQWKKGT